MGPRLLLATDSLEPSGVGEHMLALAHGLREQFDIVVAAPQEASGDVIDRALRLGVGAEAIIEGVASFLAAGAFDIAHIHAGIGWEGQGLTEQASRAGIAVIVRTEHLPYVLTDAAQQSAYRETLNHVSGLICVSVAGAASFASAGVPGTMISVVRNGIIAVEPRRQREELRRELGVRDDAPLAITVARLTTQKNHAALLATLSAILAVHPEFRLALVGTGPLEDELRLAAETWGEAVVFLGHRADVPDLLAAADIFVLPSVFEGLPISLIEAMAAGLPAVASKIGGSDEVVENGVSGLLAADGQLGEAILHILNDPRAANAMGIAARQRFAACFSHSRMCRETHEVYSRLAVAVGLQSRIIS